MKVLEQFLIGLGLQVDKKSFDNGSAAFDGIAKSALQLGGVLATKLGIQKVVGDFTNAGVALDNFNKLNGSSVENVQRLGYALKQQGGNAQDAFSMIKNIQNLMASPLTGNTGWMGEAARFGLDPRTITEASSTKDAILNVADAFEKMNQVQQVQAGKALGWDDAQIRLAQSGRDKIEELYKASDNFNKITEKQAKDAQRLSGTMIVLNESFSSAGNRIASHLVPAISDMVEGITDLYQINKGIIDIGIDKVFGGIADNIGLVTTALIFLGGSSALKGISALRSLFGLGGGAAAISGASAAVIAGGSLGAIFYSGGLGEGEDKLVRERKLKEQQERESSGGADPLAELAIQHFIKSGWTREQASGIVANLDRESALDPYSIGDNGRAVGIAQWHPSRQNDFRQWSGKSLQESSLEEQLNFVNYELSQGKERAAGDKLRSSSSAADAASIVSRFYERPADKEGEASRRGVKAEQLSKVDQRQFIFHGADEATIKRAIRSEVGEMATQAMDDMKSSEE